MPKTMYTDVHRSGEVKEVEGIHADRFDIAQNRSRNNAPEMLMIELMLQFPRRRPSTEPKKDRDAEKSSSHMPSRQGNMYSEG